MEMRGIEPISLINSTKVFPIKLRKRKESNFQQCIIVYECFPVKLHPLI